MHICSVILGLLCGLAFFPAQARERKLDFVANGRQWPEQVRYRAELPGGAVFLTSTGFTYSYYSQKDLVRIHDLMHERDGAAQSIADVPVRGHSYTVSLQGSNAASGNVPLKKTPNYYNFFQGNDPSKWAGGIAAYEEVKYTGIYNGIDLHVYSKAHALKYDFVLAPGARPSVIRFAFEGVRPKLTAGGDILIKTSVNELREKAPYAYQIIDGKKMQVTCKYILRGGVVGFELPDGYDTSKSLVIDPVLVFATYSGATTSNFGWSATYDSSGSLYAGGESFSTGWPVTTGAFQTTYGGGTDVGINKYNSNGSTLIYSTYFGGSSRDQPNTLVVNRAGELIMAGATLSANLPTTLGCYDNSFNGGTDVYVARFNASGAALKGATYLGGNNREGDISTSTGHAANRGEVYTDTAGSIYVAFATNSTNFPTTTGAFQTVLNGNLDAFISKLDSTCSNLLFSTYLGGSGNDAAISLQLSRTGNIIVGGGTTSNNFPGVTAGWQASYQANTDGFIAVLNNSGSTLLNATYVGTSGTDDVAKIQLGPSDEIYACGISTSGTFPLSPGTYSVPNSKAYIVKFDKGLSTRLVSTTIGTTGTALLNPSAFLLDVCGNLYFVAHGSITDTISGLVTTANAFQKKVGGFWMCVLNPNMSGLTYASYFGAVLDHIDGGSSRLDPSGIVYHSICTNSPSLPSTSTVWSPTRKVNNYDIASWKFDFQLAGMNAGFEIDKDTFCSPAVVTFTNTSNGAMSYRWDFGDGSATSGLANPPAHTYTRPGIYWIKLYTFNSGACKPIDSEIHPVYVLESGSVKLTPPSPLIICGRDSARIPVDPAWTIRVTPNSRVRYQVNGGSEIVFYPDTTTHYFVHASVNNTCSLPAVDSIDFILRRDTTVVGHVNPITDTILCQGDTALYELGRKMDWITIHPPGHFQVSPDSMKVKFYPPVSTRYKFLAVKSNMCSSIRDTLDFRIHRSSLKAVFELSPKLADQHHPEFQLRNYSKGAVSYNWYLDHNYWTSETSPLFIAQDTGTYCFILEAKDVYSCVDTAYDCARMLESHLYIPSAFTPNNDNKNDIFRPILNNVDIEVFAVYNRFGQRVFVTSREDQGWDGTFNGRPCDLGTYFYMIRYRVLNYDSRMLKGDVTLIR